MTVSSPVAAAWVPTAIAMMGRKPPLGATLRAAGVVQVALPPQVVEEKEGVQVTVIVTVEA